MATKRQKKVMRLVEKTLLNKEPLNMAKIMIEAGYSPKTATKTKDLTASKGWQGLLNDIEDEPLLSRLKEIALEKTDKRANIEAIKELFKLKDRYPAGKLKIGAYEERDKVIE